VTCRSVGRGDSTRRREASTPSQILAASPETSNQPDPTPRRTAMIETNDLTKMYGELYALNRLNLTLNQGDVYGFIGPNGAGKTTTMRILATLLNPSWGEATVCGYSIYTGSKEIRRVIGYMPDFFGVYDDMKVIEYLEFFASAYRIKGPARKKICEEVLELVDLTYKRDALVTSLSRGMTQRLGLARTLLHDPQVLLLDEPASGLDPRARIEMRALLKELRSMGKTILVSSHILPELADICNKIGIIEQGCLLVNGEVTEVMKQVRSDVVLNIAVSERLTDAANMLESQPEVESVQDKNGVLIVKLNEGVHQYSFLASRLINQGYDLTLFKEDEINLETAFMHLTKGITS
jgi:ABC-2 type transport system ATP-binding protein